MGKKRELRDSDKVDADSLIYLSAKPGRDILSQFLTRITSYSASLV